MTEQEPEPEVEIVSEATELKQEFTDEAGNVTQRVLQIYRKVHLRQTLLK